MILVLEILLMLGALAVAAECLRVMRADARERRDMFGVQIHDDWLAQDPAFLAALEVAMRDAYRRRSFEDEVKSQFRKPF